jgi:hypothetical protein
MTDKLVKKIGIQTGQDISVEPSYLASRAMNKLTGKTESKEDAIECSKLRL